MVTVVTVTLSHIFLSTMGSQLDKVIRDNVPYTITITLCSPAYNSELVQLSEQVGSEAHSRAKKILTQHKIIHHQNISSYNTPYSGSRGGRVGSATEARPRRTRAGAQWPRRPRARARRQEQ
jgi:hypothetical protein